VPPALGLARVLSERGHDVRVLAPATLRARVEAVGARWCPHPEATRFDAAAGRAMDDQGALVQRTFFGDELPGALRDELARERAEALVVDALLATTVSEAQASGVPVAALVHTLGRFHALLGAWGAEETNAFRAARGLEPVDPTPALVTGLQRECELELVALPAELDVREVSAPNVVHVGPLAEDGSPPPPPDLPWAEDDPRPLVVVGLSTSYMHQEALLERILDALAALPVRVLATTGPELDPAEVRAPAGVELRRYVRHDAVLPEAALVVTHAGTGTLVAAFAAGVPCVYIPLGRDQPVNAALVAELGLGLALPPDAPVEAIRAAVGAALASDALHAAARRMQDAIAAYGAGARAVDALEALAGRST
jgi:UDP:flavonoid glycosyltransferase YjiC (YdhE family)